ncbi:MAG TPA: hypothetical protein IAB46_05890 [Candidatus Scybalocola faecigallinarum]|uniref:Uncharacterized protein n=1 Tax=Candidatus Scybalocola faecigallinarum TaxID=2840941 RepID=A0A9D1JQE8_9FIRM|nr:hypothetical protein [Candidatus Scybalocola faecigallinarum]
MQINNIFQEESLKYSQEKPELSSREDEIFALSEISEYLAFIEENLQFSDELWMQEVSEGVLFYEWIYSNYDDGSEDLRRMMQEIFFKSAKEAENNSQTDSEVIPISLGDWPEACPDQNSYIKHRREILAKISNVEEYENFMHSCFINSCFSANILQEMKYIKDFPAHAREITKNLAVLNDYAISLYYKYHNDLKEAMRILSSMLLECSGDPKHRESLFFPFTYYENLNGINTAQEKKILCEPHLKLIRRDSDLRIYFQWCDDQVGKGEKVLVGRIGRHPY